MDSYCRYKCLFVSHVPINTFYGGGAGISLKTFLEHQDFLDVDLIIPLFIGYLLKWPYIIHQAMTLKPSMVSKIYFLPLPLNNCQEGAPVTLKAKAAYFINNKIAWFFAPLTRKILFKTEYKFVHFNSIVLNQLICRKNSNRQVIHVREVIDRKSKFLLNAISNILNADGLIFIDKRTSDSVRECSQGKLLPCSSVINNPFDMTSARQWRLRRQKICDELGLGDESNTFYAYFGMLHPVKGADLIIRAFIESHLDKAKLLIVGAGNQSYTKYYQSLAKKGGDSIIFLARMEYHKVMKLYAVSDFVVRGDPDFRIGRTVYEALYAGCKVIIPGNQKNLLQEFDLQPFASKIFIYKPKDTISLAQTLRSTHTKSSMQYSENTPTKNIVQHCDEIKNFIDNCLFTQDIKPS